MKQFEDTVSCESVAADSMLAQLAEIRDLPTLPAVFMRIMRMMQSKDTSIREISQVVEADQSIAMKVLRLINSSFYGLSRSVYSVQQAIVLLGANTLKNILISASVFQALNQKNRQAGWDRQAFWKHTMECGMIARCLDDKINCGREEEGFTCGIIHDIGKVVLDQYFHDKLLKVLSISQADGISFHQAERELFGITHAELGSKLADLWYLPDNLVEVIAQHHDFRPDGEYARQAALTQISNKVAYQYAARKQKYILVPEVDPLCWHTLDLDPKQLIRWDDDIRCEIEKADELLNLMLD